jgi:transcriptional regulator of acetoin/glycerol metabolism
MSARRQRGDGGRAVPPRAGERARPSEAAIRDALREAHGIYVHAARRLGIPRSTFHGWMTSRDFAPLSHYASALRSDCAPPHQGRPFAAGDNRSRQAVAAAWEKSGHTLSVCARALGLPRSSVRHLLHRYRLPNLPASGR